MSDPDAKDHYLLTDWPGMPANVHALTTLRHGGYSTGPYASFNLAAHVEDHAGTVAANRGKLIEDLGLSSQPVWLNQVHGNSVIRLERDAPAQVPDADACVAHTPGVACAVMTADCLPVFFTSIAGDEVAVAHAGWRGLHAGVISATVAAMDAAPEQILVYLGPAIGPQAVEVGDEVYGAFLDSNPANGVAFTAVEQGDGNRRYLCDIYQLARLECQALGVGAVSGGGMCTYTDSERFFSFRRQKTTGRMANLIWIDNELTG